MSSTSGIPNHFNPVTTTATDLALALEVGTLSSEIIVRVYLAQIQKRSPPGVDGRDSLNALISVAPEEMLVQRARELDDERRRGYVRGKLHGLPIVVKDAIMTDPDLGMPTTAGAVAFKDCFAQKNAAVIDYLLEQGMIILGKANLTEFCGLKAKAITPGWSALGGQTKSAYGNPGASGDDHVDPGGSSAGSAVAVSAGLAPFALGTETAGSTVYPASRAALYAIKPSHGAVSTEGVFALSKEFDCVGMMAKSALDLEMLLQGLPLGLGSNNQKESRGVFLLVQRSQYENIPATIAAQGGRIVYPLDAPKKDTIRYDGKSGVHMVSYSQSRALFKEFCEGLIDPPVHTLEELVKYNADHPEETMPEPHPDQDELLSALHNTTSPDTAAQILTYIRYHAGPAGMERTMAEHDVDLVAGPSDCNLVTFAAAAGWPIATVPIGTRVRNGQPFGLFVLGRKGAEGRLLRFMRAYEMAFKRREAPP